MNELDLPYELALDELQRELSANGRIKRLIQRVADCDELSLYRSSARVAEYAPLVHITASAASIRTFIEKITAEPKALNKDSKDRR